jgi:hypothetical protein
MSAQNSFYDLLQEYLRLTLEETEALRAHEWPHVDQCQSAKRELQTKFPSPADLASLPPEGPERRLAQELIAMQTANRAWLEERKAVVKVRRLELENSSQNLRRVRASYVRREALGWQCYG